MQQELPFQFGQTVATGNALATLKPGDLHNRLISEFGKLRQVPLPLSGRHAQIRFHRE